MGDGHSLDADDGDPADVVYVEDNGTTRLGMGTQNPDFGTTVRIAGVQNRMALEVDGDSYFTSVPAAFVRGDSTTAIIAHANRLPGSMTYPVTPTSVAGISSGDANGAYFSAGGTGVGVWTRSGGSGAALRATGTGTGYSGYFEGGHGVYMERDTSYPVLDAHNPQGAGFYGDVAWFSSQQGVSLDTWTLNTTCYGGTAGRFMKYTDDNRYAVTIDTPASTCVRTPATRASRSTGSRSDARSGTRSGRRSRFRIRRKTRGSRGRRRGRSRPAVRRGRSRRRK